MPLTVGSMFAGYGGIELALSSVLDVEPVWFAEFDAAPSRILAHHWPDVPNLGDVTKVDWTTVPKVDVITGGSPCQDLSHAGKRAGMTTGTRSNLWVEMREAIAHIRPRLVCWENVRGAGSAEAASSLEQCPRCVGGAGDGKPVLRALGRVLGDLSDLGYDSWWYGLRASDVDLAHGRFRFFLFATPRDSEGVGVEGIGAGRVGLAPAHARPGLPVRSGADPARGLTLLPTPTTVEGTGPGSHGTDGDNLRTVVDQLLPTPRATDGTKGGPNQRGSSGDLMLPSAVQKMLPTPVVTDASGSARHTTDTGVMHSGTSLTDAIRQDWREYEAAIRRQETAFGRPAPPPTETGPKGKPRLSPRFVEWLMALPEGWVTDVPGITRNDQLKALGNGVVPQQCAAALRAFLADTAKERAA